MQEMSKFSGKLSSAVPPSYGYYKRLQDLVQNKYNVRVFY